MTINSATIFLRQKIFFQCIIPRFKEVITTIRIKRNEYAIGKSRKDEKIYGNF
jgi:hypothetical protein